MRTEGIYIEGSSVTEIPDGGDVEIQVFGESQNPATDTPVKRWPVSVEGGRFLVDIPQTISATYPDTIQLAIVVTMPSGQKVRRLVQGANLRTLLARATVATVAPPSSLLLTPEPGATMEGKQQEFTIPADLLAAGGGRWMVIVESRDGSIVYYNGGAPRASQTIVASGLPTQTQELSVRYFVGDGINDPTFYPTAGVYEYTAATVAVVPGVYSHPTNRRTRLHTAADPQPATPGIIPAALLQPADNLGIRTMRLIDQPDVLPSYSKVQAFNDTETHLLFSFRLFEIASGALIKVLSGGQYQWIPGNEHEAIARQLANDSSGPITKLIKYNKQTDSYTNLRNFSQFTEISMGDGEGSLSESGRYVALIGNDGSGRHVLGYDIQTDTILGSVLTNGFSPVMNWCGISPSGDYIVIEYNQNGFTNPSRVRYNRDMTNPVQMLPFGHHCDIGKDNLGRDVLVSIGGDYLWYQVLSTLETVLIPISGPPYSTVNGQHVGQGHVSCKQFKRPGWCTVSITDPLDMLNAASRLAQVELKIDPSGVAPSNVGPYTSAIAAGGFPALQIGVASVESWGFSNSDDNFDYNSQPHATTSPSGTKMAYGSNRMGNDRAFGYIKIFPQ